MINMQWGRWWKKKQEDKIEENSTVSKIRVEIMKLQPNTIMLLQPDNELSKEEIEELKKELKKIIGQLHYIPKYIRGVKILMVQKEIKELDEIEKFNFRCNGEFPKDTE